MTEATASFKFIGSMALLRRTGEMCPGPGALICNTHTNDNTGNNLECSSYHLQTDKVKQGFQSIVVINCHQITTIITIEIRQITMDLITIGARKWIKIWRR
uniref:Uncharacterized protein n=1 Tax=Romanomermis culicivorax TaxID=13658 RepID=A0A915I3E6_ROMCU